MVLYGETSAASAVVPDVVQMDYSTDFPKLPEAAPAAAKVLGAWSRPAVGTKTIVHSFILAADERANKVKTFGGNTSEEHKKCQAVAAATGTRIELSESKDGALTVVIKGLRNKVEDARARLVRDLQTQASRDLDIPKDHHRKLIGKEGTALRQLEADTNCRITIPSRDTPSQTIKIVGPREGIEKAVAYIKSVSDRESLWRVILGGVSGKEGTALRQLEADTNCRITIPSRDTPSQTIKIVGPREGIEKAVAYIKSVSDRESLWRVILGGVSGKEGTALRQLEADTNCRITIPSRDTPSQTIKIVGPREGIEKAVAYIKSVSDREADAAGNALLDSHAHDKEVLVRPSRIPNRGKVQIDFEDSGTIFLEGAPEEVKAAFNVLSAEVARLEAEMAIEKVKVHPSLHRHVIGRGGTLISKIKDETGVQISIPNEQTNSDEIVVEGKKEGVKKAVEDIRAVVSKIENEKSRDIIIEQRLHKLIIGTKGENIGKIRDAHPNVVLSFPDVNKKSDVINIRGDKAEVDKVYKQLQMIAKELIESNYQQTVPIFKEFHKHIIGKGGATIRKIREETQTRIDLPEGDSGEERITVTGKKANVEKAIDQLNKIQNELGDSGEERITVTGKKANVEKAIDQLNKIQNELANIETVEVDIPVKVQSRLLGNGRRLISDIEEECGGVHIKFPAEKSESTKGDSGEERITVTGKKANVEKAIDQLNKIQNELANIETVEVDIPVKVQSRLLGNGRRLISDIEEECGGVHIKFPAEKSESTKVTIRGPKGDVEKARKHLTELARDKEINLHEDKVVARPEFHRFLIGKGGGKINKIREHYDVRVMFPRETDEDKETIHLLGKKEDVLKVKKELEENVKQLNETIEATLEVDTKHHRHFVMRNAAVLREIQEQNGGVTISFPKMGADSTTVHIKGSKQCVESAKARIEEIIEDIEKQVNMQVEIPSQFHRALLANRGQRIHDLQSKHGVLIRFPDRRAEGSEEADPHAADMVTISGRDTKCEAAKTELLSMVPVSKVINVPIEMHRGLIGRGGETVRKLMQDYDVNISIPKNNESDEITVTGPSENVEEALEKIREKIAEFEALAEDRRLRSFQLVIDVPAEYHQRVIGPKGATVNALRAKHDVQISLPRGDEKSDQITIQGYEAAARACAAEIDEMIEEIRSMFTQEVSIDAGFHPRMIGVRGKNLKKLMEDYGVEIRFPRDAADPNLVIIAGKSEDAVYDCIDHLRIEEEEYLADHIDRNQYISTRVQEPPKQNKPIQMNNAPWQLDIGSAEHFPDMGSSAPSHTGVGGAWGSARRW
ncbi:KH domain protein [Cooperia oncophora]